MIYKTIAVILLSIIIFCSCKKNNIAVVPDELSEIRACDLSFLPEIRATGYVYRNSLAQADDALILMKKEGMNVVRLRLWNNPSSVHSSFQQVKAFTQELKSNGLKVWITLHYSDTWADPGTQTKPLTWNKLSFNQLKDSVYRFTQKVMKEIQPDYIQIGNEINSGLLWPEGNIANKQQMIALVEQGIKAVRDESKQTKIMIHFAGHEFATAFFSNFIHTDYDMIALSYYPIWHGKNLNQLQSNIQNLVTQFNKEVVIAETSYPFTLGWNDWTNNIVGLESQLLNEFNATESGQQMYLNRMRTILQNTPKGKGFCYWGAEWVAFRGSTATNGSSWENQALWDFNGKLLPVAKIFNARR